MYKIVYRLFNNNLTVTEYGFSKYILERYLSLCKEEKIESIEIFPLTKYWSAFKKCWKNFCKIS